MNMPRLSAFLFLVVVPLAAQGPRVVATGLRTPQKLVRTTGGNFLVAEPSAENHAGRVSFVSRGGERRSLLEGLPSGIEVVGGPAGPTAMALDGRILYLAIGSGETERRGEQPGTSIHNPVGLSSPIWASILKFEFNLDVDALGGTFPITPAMHQSLSVGGEVDIEDGAGGAAHISMLVDLPNSYPDPVTIYRFSNPWGLALTPDGETLYVSDASQNYLLRVDTATGRWRRVAAFPPLPNVGAIGPPVVDAVPTSVRIYGNQLLVSFLTGFPFAPGHARVLAVNPTTGATEPFIFGLTSAVDVVWRQQPGGARQFFVLEFSQNQSAAQPPPGRLLRYDSPSGTVMAGGLITPVSMVVDDDAVFVLELATGRILEVGL